MGMPAVNLSHTPSIYYALGYFISSCILVAINRRRLSFKKLLAVSLLYYVCLSGFMYATDGVDDLFYVITMLLVFGLMAFFKMCDVTFLVYFSIPAAMVYMFGFYLISRTRLDFYIRMVYVWLTFYMGVTTVCLGTDYGFHLYCFSMIPVIFVSEYLSYKLKRNGVKAVYISIGVAVFYLLCTGYVSAKGPVYEREQSVSTFFWLFNSLTVLVFLIGYINYLITMIINSEEKLREIALVDRLTGLYNRHFMLDRLSEIGEPEPGFLALADIDDFKKINDVYGHNAGDEVLKTVSERMRDTAPKCIISRWGGEEFLIRVPGNIADGKALLEKLRLCISSEPVEYEGRVINVTVTIGAAERKDGQTVDNWIQDADDKLYEGKNSGKNKVVC